MSHHVVVRLPDGRHAIADYRLPIVATMRRINRALGDGEPPRPADYATIAAWLDTSPEAACDRSCRDDNGKHPPASQEPQPR